MADSTLGPEYSQILACLFFLANHQFRSAYAEDSRRVRLDHPPSRIQDFRVYPPREDGRTNRFSVINAVSALGFIRDSLLGDNAQARLELANILHSLAVAV